jgi:anti-sigma B factor antagonist
MANAAPVNTIAFRIESKDTTAIVHCRGRLVAGLCGEFHSKIRPLFQDHTRVVLDLTELESVDSMGLGTLVRLNVSARSAGSCLELVNLGKQVRQLLGLTNLLSLFGEMCEKGVSMKF